jgi:hypothetical protein
MLATDIDSDDSELQMSDSLDAISTDHDDIQNTDPPPKHHPPRECWVRAPRFLPSNTEDEDVDTT